MQMIKIIVLYSSIALCLYQTVSYLKLRHNIVYGHVKLNKKDFKCEPWPYSKEKIKKNLKGTLKNGSSKF